MMLGRKTWRVTRKTVRLVGSKGGQEVVAIFGSGATYFCIQPELA